MNSNFLQNLNLITERNRHGLIEKRAPSVNGYMAITQVTLAIGRGRRVAQQKVKFVPKEASDRLPKLTSPFAFQAINNEGYQIKQSKLT